MTDTPDPWQPRSRMRAGDNDRQQAMDGLTRAWRAGRIDRKEFQERSEDCLDADYLDELDELLADIGGLPSLPTIAPYQPGTGGQMVIRDSWQSEPDPNLLPVRLEPEAGRGAVASIGIMGGMNRGGPWIVPEHHVAVGFWGGATIDLRHAIFTSPETTITCIGFMGGVEVIVPPDMDVEVAGIGFMGGFGWDKLRDAAPRRGTTSSGVRVRINGLGMMGGVGVVRKAAYEDDD